MPAPHPLEFRQRAVELARMREKPVSEIASDLGISDSCLRNWMEQADLDEGRRSETHMIRSDYMALHDIVVNDYAAIDTCPADAAAEIRQIVPRDI